MRPKSRGFSETRRIRLQRAIIPVLLLALLASVILYVLVRNSEAVLPDTENDQIQKEWDAQNYEQVAVLTGAKLLDEPLNSRNLLYNGIANFYYALTLVNQDEREGHLNSSIHALRKLLYDPPAGFQQTIWYILGKAYFHKGPYYYDLSEKYLSMAEDSGFTADDILEYLGVIHLDYGEIDSGISYIRQAIENSPRAVLFLTIAEAYEEQGNTGEALEYYEEALNRSEDSFLRQEASLGKGRTLFRMEEFDKAQEIFEAIIDRNSQSAQAYFYLGEIFAEAGDMVKARAQWREAYNQDRTFRPALERLQS